MVAGELGEYRVRGTKVYSPYPVDLTPAETRLVFSLQRYFAPERIFPDCYFPKTDGQSMQKQLEVVVSDAKLLQIDCLAVNRAGIFVFESKGYSGWIYGHAKYHEWTQVLAFGREKHRFYNPVKQNETHVETVRDLFSGKYPVYSVVVFGREAELKVIDELPEEVKVCTQVNLGAVLTQMSANEILSADEVARVCEKIQRSRVNPTTIVRDEHIEEVKVVEENRAKRRQN